MINTLMTNQEVQTAHKGDNVSARVTAKLGMVKWTRFGFLKLEDKIIFKINTCPYCGGTNSFHYRNNQPNNHEVDNVYKVYINNTKKSVLVHKIDYCLDCHKEFSIEMYGWAKLTLIQGLLCLKKSKK